MKKIVLIAMGGDSTERDISVITGLQALKNIDKTHYTPMVAYQLNGVFYTGVAAESLSFYKKPKLSALSPLLFSGKTAYRKTRFGLKTIGEIYAALMCFHGGTGEGGGAAGFFETLGIPQTSADVFVSALLLDKCAAKRAFEHIGIPSLEGQSVDRRDYLSGKITVNEIIDGIGFPIIIKPAHLGSSIGINVATDTETLIKAIDTAFSYDSSLLAERALPDYFELNLAVYRSLSEVVVSEVEKPVRREVILDFADKYLGGQGHGMESLKREIPANITEELKKEVERYGTLLYEVLNLQGVVRIDFLYDNAGGRLYMNEVNTIPGSLALYLFRNKRKTARRILTDLIETAVKRKSEKAKFITVFDSTVFDKIQFSIKK